MVPPQGFVEAKTHTMYTVRFGLNLGKRTDDPSTIVVALWLLGIMKMVAFAIYIYNIGHQSSSLAIGQR